MPEAGTRTNLAHTGTGGSDCRGMGPADPETGQRVSSVYRPEEWRVASGGGQMADGGCRADDVCGVSLGGCVAVESSEPMAQEYPDVPAERTRNRKKAPNKAKLESTQISASKEVESGLNGQVG